MQVPEEINKVIHKVTSNDFVFTSVDGIEVSGGSFYDQLIDVLRHAKDDIEIPEIVIIISNTINFITAIRSANNNVNPYPKAMAILCLYSALNENQFINTTLENHFIAFIPDEINQIKKLLLKFFGVQINVMEEILTLAFSKGLAEEFIIAGTAAKFINLFKVSVVDSPSSSSSVSSTSSSFSTSSTTSMVQKMKVVQHISNANQPQNMFDDFISGLVCGNSPLDFKGKIMNFPILLPELMTAMLNKLNEEDREKEARYCHAVLYLIYGISNYTRKNNSFKKGNIITGLAIYYYIRDCLAQKDEFSFDSVGLSNINQFETLFKERYKNLFETIKQSAEYVYKLIQYTDEGTMVAVDTFSEQHTQIINAYNANMAMCEKSYDLSEIVATMQRLGINSSTTAIKYREEYLARKNTTTTSSTSTQTTTTTTSTNTTTPRP